MLPAKHVWVFVGEGGPSPGGVFSSRANAEAWIRARKLSGTLTAYPVDEGVFDWALRTGAVTGRARERGDEPPFVGSFTSAVQEHFHYVDGVEAALEHVLDVGVSELSQGRFDPAELRRALARFFKRGLDAGVSTGELVDLLGVSSPSVLDRAGFTDVESGRAMDVVSQLTDEEIAASM